MRLRRHILRGSFVRSFGFGWLFGALAFARFLPNWERSALFAVLVIGIGFGLGNWETGD